MPTSFGWTSSTAVVQDLTVSGLEPGEVLRGRAGDDAADTGPSNTVPTSGVKVGACTVRLDGDRPSCVTVQWYPVRRQEDDTAAPMLARDIRFASAALSPSHKSYIEMVTSFSWAMVAVLLVLLPPLLITLYSLSPSC